jgi:hypothetical protein
MSHRLVVISLLHAVFAVDAAAAPPPPTGSRATLPRPVAGHALLELRGGASAPTGPNLPIQRATLCGELTPLRRIGIESCGNGAGTLHNDAVADFFHIRARVTALELSRGRAEGALVVGVGIAEVTRTADAPGLRFGQASEANPIEAAGSELSFSAKGRWWATDKAHLVGDLNIGVAHIPGAPAVVGTQGSAVPFATFTAGLGF